ncbi:type II secretion system F family protein [Marinobacter sediminum]|uniref:type II secretion system F family protein n=1 Tax=Marinobacter sediminum TaxID=256323 RepID=UPI0020301A51|nr:type II secretion system F family protein [Marinobacter sediminum]MCM0612009.1 type II secretion system F family protein [Marinobacter sediminum]
MEASVYSVYIISFLAFVAVLALIEGGYLLWRSLNVERSVKVSKRLRAMSAMGMKHREAISILRERHFSEVPFLNRLLDSIPRSHALDRLLEQAGVSITVSRFILIQLGLSLALFIILYWAVGALMLIALPLSLVLGFLVPHIYVVRKKTRRSDLFTQQLPDALDYIARSLRAGNPFSAAIRSVSHEMADPIATEFGAVFDELNYGVEMEDALHHLGERSGNEEIRYFIAAVLIQRTTGGNLAEILNQISHIMRARASTYREIKILSTEMQYSANILVALPFVVALILAVLSPGYLAVLFNTELGLVIVGVQLLLMGMGYWIVRRMVHFRV